MCLTYLELQLTALFLFFFQLWRHYIRAAINCTVFFLDGFGLCLDAGNERNTNKLLLALSNNEVFFQEQKKQQRCIKKTADLLLSSGGSGPLLMERLFSESQNMNEVAHNVLCMDLLTLLPHTLTACKAFKLPTQLNTTSTLSTFRVDLSSCTGA